MARHSGTGSPALRAEAAEAQYWDALADDEFERYERKQRFIDHFAAVLSEAGQWIGPIPVACQELSWY